MPTSRLHCYRCHRSAQTISSGEWARLCGQDLISTPIPVHMSEFWHCSRCNETGARVSDFAWYVL